jgi:hypothetical protein
VTASRGRCIDHHGPRAIGAPLKSGQWRRRTDTGSTPTSSTGERTTVARHRASRIGIDSELRKKLNSIRASHDEAIRVNGHMSSETIRLISKALHSDKGMPTAKQLEDAFKAFNAWKSDSKAARRQG